MNKSTRKPLFWMGSSRKDIRDFPTDVRIEVGHALSDVQRGLTPHTAKPLRGFGGASVLEIVEDSEEGAYRAVYTVRFAGLVYVLHVFQKKAKRGIATPQADLDLIKQRLVAAQAHYQEWLRYQQQGN